MAWFFEGTGLTNTQPARSKVKSKSSFVRVGSGGSGSDGFQPYYCPGVERRSTAWHPSRTGHTSPGDRLHSKTKVVAKRRRLSICVIITATRLAQSIMSSGVFVLYGFVFFFYSPSCVRYEQNVVSPAVETLSVDASSHWRHLASFRQVECSEPGVA